MEQKIVNPASCAYVYPKGQLKGQRCEIVPRASLYCHKHMKTSQASVVGSKVDNPLDVPINPHNVTINTLKEENTIKVLEDPVFSSRDSCFAREDNRGIGEEPDTILGGLLVKDIKGSQKSKKKRSVDEKTTVVTLTMNSNQPIDKMSDELKKAFKSLNEIVYGDPLRFFSDRGGSINDVIKKVDTDYHYEASSSGLVHSHGIIKITHTGFLKWHANEVRKLAKELMGKNIHLDSGLSSDPVHGWEQYMSKQANKLVF